MMNYFKILLLFSVFAFSQTSSEKISEEISQQDENSFKELIKAMKLEILAEVKDNFHTIIREQEEKIISLKEDIDEMNKALSSDIKVAVKSNMYYLLCIQNIIFFTEQGLKEPPMTYFCAYKEKWVASDRVVSYDRLSFEYAH